MKKRFFKTTACLILAICLVAAAGCSKVEEGKINAAAQGPQNEKVIPMDDIQPISNFQEGLLIVERLSDGKVYCIDKNGEIQFQLSDEYEVTTIIEAGFYNGLCVVERYDDATDSTKYELCKTDGTIVTAETLGCEELLGLSMVMSHVAEGLLKDGYFLAVADGKVGVMDTGLNWVVPASEQYGNTLNAYMEESADERVFYGQGRFLSKYGYFDVLTGETGAIADIIEEIAYPSNYWSFASNGGRVSFYNKLSMEPERALELSDVYGKYTQGMDYPDCDDVVPAFDFYNGYAAVIVRAEEGNQFSIINDKGQLVVSPVSVCGDNVRYDEATDLYCVEGMSENGDLVIDIFNISGKVSSFTYDLPETATSASASVEDGVVLICILTKSDETTTRQWVLMDLNFELLY